MASARTPRLCLRSVRRPPARPPRWLTLHARYADLHSKFREQHKEYSPEPRSFYGYVTCVVVRPAVSLCVCAGWVLILWAVAGHEGDGVDVVVGCAFSSFSLRERLG